MSAAVTSRPTSSLLGLCAWIVSLPLATRAQAQDLAPATAALDGGAVGLAMGVVAPGPRRDRVAGGLDEPLAASRVASVAPRRSQDGPPTTALLRSERPARDAASSPRGSRALPWVTTLEWEVPDAYGADVFEGQRTEFRPWAHFGEELRAARTASDPPAHAGVLAPDSFVVFEPLESQFSRQFRRLVRAKLYRELRSKAKREWKSLYLAHSSMAFADYESRLFLINNLGKNRDDHDDFSMRATATEAKQDFFGRRRVDGESDIPLLTWGPFTVKDTGSVKLDLGRAASGISEDEEVEVGTEPYVPIVATRDYEVKTSFHVDVDPLRGSAIHDPRDAVRQVGVTVEVTWLSAVLGREQVTTEVELETDLYGDYKGFFNLVIKNR